MLGEGLRVTDSHKTPRLEEVIAFISQVSPDFSKVAPQVRAELDMEPKSKPKYSRKRTWGPWPELEKDKGGILLICLAQLAKDQGNYLTF